MLRKSFHEGAMTFLCICIFMLLFVLEAAIFHDHVVIYEARHGILIEYILRIALCVYLVGWGVALFRLFEEMDKKECYILDVTLGVYNIRQVKNEKAWYALVPIWNGYKLCDLLYGNGWYCLFYLAPAGRWLFLLYTAYRTAKAAGKKPMAMFVLIFAPVFFHCDAWETEPGGNKKLALASAIAGLLFSLCFIASVLNSGYPLHTIKFEDDGSAVTVVSIADEMSALDEKRKVNQYIQTVIIPSRHNGMPVEQIGRETNKIYGLIEWGVLRYIRIPDSVTAIYQGVSHNRNLTTAHISKNVEYIADYAFEENCYMKANDFTDHVKQIGCKAFYQCNNIAKGKTLYLPEIETIGAGAFDRIGCNDIVIGEACKRIESHAFNLAGGSTITIYGNPDITFWEQGTSPEWALAFVSHDYFYDNAAYTDIILRGYAGSSVERYAKKHGYEFEKLPMVSSVGTTTEQDMGQKVRNDTEPLKAWFPKLEGIVFAEWEYDEDQKDSFPLLPAPGSYSAKGYIVLDNETAKAYLSSYEWKEAVPDVAMKYVSSDRLENSTWLFSAQFDKEFRPRSFIGQLWFDGEAVLFNGGK